MALAKYKTLIGVKVADVIKKSSCNIEVNPELIGSLISVQTNKKDNTLQLQLPLEPIEHNYKGVKVEDFNNLDLHMKQSIQNISNRKSRISESHIVFNLNNTSLTKHVLNDYEYFFNLKIPAFDIAKRKKKVVIEFSSPNIAKPFHIGNFRSTIIGNYLSNLYEHLSYDVIRLTYLGDWGTQFGLLQVGLEMLGLTEDEISKRPIELLFKAYVKACKESEHDPIVLSKAKEIFNSMEHDGNENVLSKWKLIRQYATEELERTYERICVKFDGYDWESNYPVSQCASIISLLQNRNYLAIEDGKTAFKLKNNSSVTLLKSDGSSLYITRDILAAIDRQKRYNFDEMLYVTDFSQQEHFTALDEILGAIDESWENKIRHVKFGRIRGMSTRKGEVVFLKDILDEAKLIMEEKQRVSPSMW